MASVVARDELKRRLVEWIEIPSVTGDEEDYALDLERSLVRAGFAVELQDVGEPNSGGRRRFNVLACAQQPDVVFCTHIDTVPPFFPSRIDREYVYGRGACDAKGQAVAMIEAGRRLLEAGTAKVGFLFTVGEEIDSVGASAADQLADPWRPKHVIIGEPTDERFIGAHKGIYKVRLVAKGVAGHSSQDIGPSAVHELVGCAHGLLGASWGSHDLLGPGTLNFGTISGGVAPNVVADHAETDLLIRTVESPEVVEARVREHLGEHVEIVPTYKAYAPVEFHVPEGEEPLGVAFGTDAPHMQSWGKPLLYGCGSILDAHTDDEKLELASLERCVERHVRTVSELLQGA